MPSSLRGGNNQTSLFSFTDINQSGRTTEETQWSV